MICATFGIYTLMKPHPQILDAFKWIGALYLIYLALRFLKRKTGVTIDKTFGTRSALDLFKDGFVSALFSPGAIVFFVVMFPTFLDPNNNFLVHLIILMTTHVILDFFFLTIYAGRIVTVTLVRSRKTSALASEIKVPPSNSMNPTMTAGHRIPPLAAKQVGPGIIAIIETPRLIEH